MKSLDRMVFRLVGGLCVMLLLSGSVLKAETPLERLVAQGGESEMTINVEHTRMASTEFDEYVSDYLVYTYDSRISDDINQRVPKTISVVVPTPKGEFTLKVVEHKVTSPDFIVESSSGQTTIEGQLGTHYRGIVEGHDGSFASISFIYGQMTLMASTRELGNFTVNSIDDQNRYVSYFDSDLLVDVGNICHTPEPEGIPEFLQNERMRQDILNQRQGGDERCLRIHFEADWNLWLNKGGVANTAAYVEGFFGQVAALYANEDINMVLSYLNVWDTPDPFAPGTGGSGDALQAFQNYILTGANLNGDLGHLAAFDPGGNGGIANGIGTLCLNEESRIAYSDINTTFSNFPTYSWTVQVVAHEMGHNIGSPHTHGCYWNNDGTQIDDCGNIATFPNHEGNPCYQQFTPIVPAAGGVTMSYCHLNAVGINMSLGFGDQSGDLIRTFYFGASCLSECPDDGCSVVYNLAIENISETEAEVTWYHPTATNFEVTYGHSGSETTVPVSDAESLMLTGLDSGEKYTVTVSAVCDAIVSDGVTTDFNTICDEIYTLPYIELFEEASWDVGSYELDACWSTLISDGNYGWSVEDFETSSSNTGPSGDHTTGFGKYVYAEASIGEQNEETELVSPQIDLGAASGPFVSFWYHMFGETLNRVGVDITDNDGLTWDQLQSIVGQQQGSEDEPWQQSILDLTDYEGETIRLRFTAVKGADFQGDIAIDDVIITDSTLTDVSITAITSPTSGCGIGASENVIVTIENSGYTTLTNGTQISLDLELNGGSVATENVTLTSDLEPGQFVAYEFVQTLDLSSSGEYAVSVSSTLAGDEVSGNNSRGINVVNKPIISVYPYTQSFESGSDWTSGGVESSWALGTPAKSLITGASDGENAWVTGGLGLEQYNALEESYVEGPCFDFSNLLDATVTMDVWWEIEPFWEGAQFQSSIDGGQTWQAVGDSSENWYNGAYILTMLPDEGGAGWTGTVAAEDGDRPWLDGSDGWVTVTRDISYLAGEESVFLRMLLKTDPFVQFDGIAFDNIIIDGTPDVPRCHDITVNAVTCEPGQAGEDVVVLQDVEGCDSVVTTITTLLTSYDVLVQEYSCEPGDTGSVVTTYTAQTTCDSVVTVRTDLWPSYDITVMQETCDPDDVGTENLDLSTVNGCDSLVEVITTLKEPYAVIIEEASCNPADTGSVVMELTASDGCDSTVTTNTALTPIEAGFSFVENDGVVTFSNSSTNATEYDWTFDDGNTNDEENPTNTYTTSGDYTVTLIASNPGCESDTETVVITISIISGIDLISFIESVNVFPNPSDGNFAVEIKGEAVLEDLSFTLFNVAGKALESREVIFNNYVRETYNMNDLPNGIYFLRIQSDNEQTTLKVNVLR